jgi:hypothetical protein
MLWKIEDQTKAWWTLAKNKFINSKICQLTLSQQKANRSFWQLARIIKGIEKRGGQIAHEERYHI